MGELPDDGPALTPSLRKHRAKRFNEWLKLAATLFNSLAIITFGTAFVSPIAQGRYDVLSHGGWILLVVAVGLHLMAQAAIRLLRPED